MRTALTGIKAIVPNARNTASPWRRLKVFLPDRWLCCRTRPTHSERRFRAIGYTDKGRGVFIVFTFRKKGDEVLIRPISARYMHKKEVDAYEKENLNL